VILVTSYTIQAALIIKSIRKAGIKASLIGGDSWSYRITNYTGELGGKNYFITGWSETLTDKNTKSSSIISERGTLIHQ
jgi:ABC-type branched-subunit amino acid transport system substrate-binding protein